MIFSISFHSSRPGTLRPMQAAVAALNADRRVTINKIGDLQAVWRGYRAAKRECAFRGDRLTPVIINCGAATTRAQTCVLLKFMLPSSLCVQIGKPRKNYYGFDLVASIPGNDPERLKGKQVITLSALPTLLGPEKLEADRAVWRGRMKVADKKLIAIFIGGGKPGEANVEAQDLIKNIKESLAMLDRTPINYDIVLTTSRRTPREMEKRLAEGLAPLCRQTYFYGRPGREENPYVGYVSCADAFIVTSDSMTMISELVDTAKPVYVWQAPSEAASAANKFYQTLLADGHVRDLKNGIDFTHPTKPIYAQNVIAAQIRQMAAKGPISAPKSVTQPLFT